MTDSTLAAGLPSDPVQLVRLLLRREGENRVLRLRLQEIKELCEYEHDGDTAPLVQGVVNIINRPMPKETM